MWVFNLTRLTQRADWPPGHSHSTTAGHSCLQRAAGGVAELAGRARASRNDGSTHYNIGTVLTPRDPRLSNALEFLFGGKHPWGLIRNLTVAPVLPSHRNQVREEDFVLPRDRFGCPEDVRLVPLMRRIVDSSLEAYSSFFPLVKEHIGRNPLSPHGSMAFSAQRWGAIDWDYTRDLDWRIYLPPQIGHESGYLSWFHRTLDHELRRFGLSPVMRGKDPDGRPQVQIRDLKTGVAHGFHLYLLTLEPGFVKGSLHLGGGYTIHQAYFPEDSIDPYLEQEGLLWSRLIRRQREQYEEMFHKIAFNTFGGDDPKSQRLKTRGWYSKKAYKWYAVLADVRGMEGLEEEILDEYRSYSGDHEELAALIRGRYYALLEPETGERTRLERELSFALSMAYSRARGLQRDPYLGLEASDIAARALILEQVPEVWLERAIGMLASTSLERMSEPGAFLPGLAEMARSGRVRYADGIGDPCVRTFPGGQAGALIPSVWSFVYCDSYPRRAARAAADAGQPFDADTLRAALEALLANQLLRAIG